MRLRSRKAQRIKDLTATSIALHRENRSLRVRLGIITGSSEEAFTQAILNNLENATALVGHAKTQRGRKEVLTYLGDYVKGIADDLHLDDELKPFDR